MGKVDTRRKNLLAYITEHGSVSTRELQEVFQIKKATLSEDITALKAQGIPLQTPRGFVTIETTDTTSAYYEAITDSTIRQWLILLILSQHKQAMTFQALFNNYEEHNGEYCSADTLHKDLQALQQNEYIRYNATNHSYQLTAYNRYIMPNSDELEPFCYKYAQQQEAHSSDLELKRFHRTAVILLCGFEEKDSYKPSQNYMVHGKRSILDATSQHGFEKLCEHPYDTKVLNIRFQTRKGDRLSINLAIGLIVYSVEKNRLYLLGESSSGRTIIPIDSIIEYRVTEEKNPVFLSRQYQDIFREMFSLSVDDAVAVRVRFDNYPFVRDKINQLHKQRPNSRMEASEDTSTFIYTDQIRGVQDFSSYLRQFGKSAVVEEPDSLREQMLHSAEEVIAKYKEVHHYE